MNPTSNGSRTHHHVRTMAPRTLTRAAADSRLPTWIRVTRVTKTALSSTDLLSLRIWWSYDVTRSHKRRLGICLATTPRYTPSRAFYAPKNSC